MTIENEFYEHVIVKGDAYERGLQHGEHLKDKIAKLAHHYLYEDKSIPPWNYCEKVIRNYYIPGLKQYDPLAYRELEGISDGSGVCLDYVFLINARYDLSRYGNNPPKAEECTSACVIDENGVKIAQNWDLDSYIHDQDLCILLESYTCPNENLPRVIITLGEVGQLGRSGMNSYGLGLCANSLSSSIDYFNFPDVPIEKKELEIPLGFARRKFLTCKVYGNGLKYISQVPRHVSGNIMVATREKEAIDFEITPYTSFHLYPTFIDQNGREVLPYSDGRALLAHSNHFMSPGYVPTDTFKCLSEGGSTLFRHRRVLTRLNTCFLQKKWGKGLDLEDLKASFSDTVGFPNSLSEYINTETEPNGSGRNYMTIASVIYDLTNGIVSLCKGPPHIGKYKEYKIDLE